MYSFKERKVIDKLVQHDLVHSCKFILCSIFPFLRFLDMLNLLYPRMDSVWWLENQYGMDDIPLSLTPFRCGKRKVDGGGGKTLKSGKIHLSLFFCLF